MIGERWKNCRVFKALSHHCLITMHNDARCAALRLENGSYQGTPGGVHSGRPPSMKLRCATEKGSSGQFDQQWSRDSWRKNGRSFVAKLR